MKTLTTMNLSAISIDPTLQPRTDGLNADQVRELETVSENWPPLATVAQGEKFVLVDGFHRYAAAQNLGLATVPVTVHEMPANGDLHALAFALNAIHGRPLTLSDRRAFALRILLAHPELSDREIGRRSGLTQPPIAKLREELEYRQAIAPVDARIGGDGQVYRVSTGSPRRVAGELPEVKAEPALGQLLTSGERRTQKRVTTYLERLAVALEDQYELDGWETNEEAASACRAVLDPDRIVELAQILGAACANVLDVAKALGFDENAEEF